MLAVTRFRVAPDAPATFAPDARRVVAHFADAPGNVSAELVRSLDDPDLWAIVTRWENVGSYRRSFSGYDAKMLLTPLLGRAIDEPSAYADPDDLADPGLPR